MSMTRTNPLFYNSVKQLTRLPKTLRFCVCAHAQRREYYLCSETKMSSLPLRSWTYSRDRELKQMTSSLVFGLSVVMGLGNHRWYVLDDDVGKLMRPALGTNGIGDGHFPVYCGCRWKKEIWSLMGLDWTKCDPYVFILVKIRRIS